jgi:hypothetical protein
MNDRKIEAGINKARLTWRKKPAKRAKHFSAVHFSVV